MVQVGKRTGVFEIMMAGIAFIYFLSFLTAAPPAQGKGQIAGVQRPFCPKSEVRTSVSTDARQEGNSPAADGEASNFFPVPNETLGICRER